MKLLVCGGRKYDDEGYLYFILDAIWETRGITHVIHGGADGADSLAGAWAQCRGVQEVICAANWYYHGKNAGFVRNSSMACLKPDLVIAFPGGGGTRHMSELAQSKGLEFYRAEDYYQMFLTANQGPIEL